MNKGKKNKNKKNDVNDVQKKMSLLAGVNFINVKRTNVDLAALTKYM
jgi:hypothetical protein